MIGDIDTCAAARAGASFISPTIRTRRPCGRLALNIAKLPELEKSMPHTTESCATLGDADGAALPLTGLGSFHHSCRLLQGNASSAVSVRAFGQ